MIRLDLEHHLGRTVLEKEIADRLGVSPRRLSDWKTRGTIPLSELFSYARARGWTLDALLADDDAVREVEAVYGVPLSEDERELLDIWRHMEREDRKYFLRLMGLVTRKT